MYVVSTEIIPKPQHAIYSETINEDSHGIPNYDTHIIDTPSVSKDEPLQCSLEETCDHIPE